MATANKRRRGLPIALALVAAAAVLALLFRQPIAGYTMTGAAVGARLACACRYVAGRGIEDCEKDFEPGMQMVFLSEDETARSVTAYVPLLASDTARFRPGYGCVLDPWES
jgi:hypothetical protein